MRPIELIFILLLQTWKLQVRTFKKKQLPAQMLSNFKSEATWKLMSESPNIDSNSCMFWYVSGISTWDQSQNEQFFDSRIQIFRKGTNANRCSWRLFWIGHQLFGFFDKIETYFDEATTYRINDLSTAVLKTFFLKIPAHSCPEDIIISQQV